MVEVLSDFDALCDAVVDLLNSAELSVAFEAARFRDAKATLEKLKDLRVAVLPVKETRKQLTRGGAKQIDYEVSVAVLQKIEVASDAADAAAVLAQEIVEHLEANPPAGCANVRQTDTNTPVPFSPDHLREQHVYLAPVTMTYRVFRG